MSRAGQVIRSLVRLWHFPCRMYLRQFGLVSDQSLTLQWCGRIAGAHPHEISSFDDDRGMSAILSGEWGGGVARENVSE